MVTPTLAGIRSFFGERKKQKDIERFREELIERSQPGPILPPKIESVVSGEVGTAPGGTFTDPRTGRVTGVELPGGRTFLGLSPEEARQLISGETAKGTIPEGAPGFKGGKPAKRPREIAEAAAQLEQAGAFEEVTPRFPDLEPETPEGIAGPSRAALSAAAGPKSLVQRLRDKGTIEALPEGFELFPPIVNETEREAVLREISINQFNEAISQRESFGTFVEAIPIVGSRARKYAGGLIETPAKNADTVIAELEKLGQQATNNQEKTRSGVMPASFALNRAREMEEDIARLEGRLQQLIIRSPILRGDTDEINRMQQVIFDTKVRADNFRTAASFALTATLTETGRVVPTDEELYFELKGYKEGI